MTKRYKRISISSSHPLDTELKKMEFEQGYTLSMQLRNSRKNKKVQNLYKGSRKILEVRK